MANYIFTMDDFMVGFNKIYDKKWSMNSMFPIWEEGWALFYLFIYLFIGGTGSSTQGLALARPVLYYLNHSTTPFCFGWFWNWVSLYAWARLDRDAPIYVSCSSWDDRCIVPHTAIGWDSVSRNFAHIGFKPWSSQSLPVKYLVKCVVTHLFYNL
jgi:hypothetical protein